MLERWCDNVVVTGEGCHYHVKKHYRETGHQYDTKNHRGMELRCSVEFRRPLEILRSTEYCCVMEHRNSLTHGKSLWYVGHRRDRKLLQRRIYQTLRNSQWFGAASRWWENRYNIELRRCMENRLGTKHRSSTSQTWKIAVVLRIAVARSIIAAFNFANAQIIWFYGVLW